MMRPVQNNVDVGKPDGLSEECSGRHDDEINVGSPTTAAMQPVSGEESHCQVSSQHLITEKQSKEYEKNC